MHIFHYYIFFAIIKSLISANMMKSNLSEFYRFDLPNA